MHCDDRAARQSAGYGDPTSLKAGNAARRAAMHTVAAPGPTPWKAAPDHDTVSAQTTVACFSPSLQAAADKRVVPQGWLANLAQDEPRNAASVHVPNGRAAAVNALESTILSLRMIRRSAATCSNN
jgi:hypothetical protein